MTDPRPGRRPSGTRGRRPNLSPLWTAGIGLLAVVVAGVGFVIAPGGSGDGAGTSVLNAAAINPPHAAHRTSATATPTGTTPSPSLSPSPSPSPSLAAVRPLAAPRVPARPVPAPAVRGGGAIPGGLSGVSAGSLSQVRAWESFRGSAVTVVQTFADRGSWSTITSPWLGSGTEKFAGFAGKWVISQPFFPTGGGDMASCANGAYTTQWKQFGTWLNARGRSDSIIRLAWEFNGDWSEWSVSKTNPTTWVNCFRQVVSAMRSTDPQVRIDWTLNAHSPNAFENYPGNDYVDIIGIDTYDQWPASLNQASWDSQCNQATGLCSVIRFARSHGKQFSVPEWGLVGSSGTGAGQAGQAGGDNPFYIQQMYQTFRANADVLAYEAYFSDASGANVHSSLINPAEHPNGAATYASLW
jgi:hypothetical protein